MVSWSLHDVVVAFDRRFFSVVPLGARETDEQADDLIERHVAKDLVPRLMAGNVDGQQVALRTRSFP